MDNKKTYESIGNHLEDRLKKDTRVVEWIKWQLFDVLTLWDDESSRKEICENIEKELDERITRLQTKKNQSWMDKKQIENLKRLKNDVQKRKNENRKTEPDPSYYINLDRKQDNFDAKVIENVWNSIILRAETHDNFPDEALVNRISKNNEYNKQLVDHLESEIWKISDTIHKTNLQKIIDELKNMHTTPVSAPTTSTTSVSTSTEDVVIDATISDMWADVLKEKVAHNVEEELRKEYKEIAKWNVFKRAYFFLARWQMRNKRIKDEMKKISGKAFTGDTTIDTHTQNATDRHELEKATSLDDKIKNIDESSNIIYQNSQIDDLCKRYIQNWRYK